MNGLTMEIQTGVPPLASREPFLSYFISIVFIKRQKTGAEIQTQQTLEKEDC